MKKLVFGLIATVMFSGVSFAQANAKNPLDNVGRLHNDVVASFQSKYAGTGLSIDQICAVSKEIANSNAEVLKLNGGKPVTLNVQTIQDGAADFKNQFRTIIGNSKLSATGKVTAQEFLDHMFTLAFATEYTKYQDVYNYVVEFENGVLANSKLTASDRSAILAGTSTARYSVSYWDKKYGGSSQPNTTAKRGFWGSLVVGICDVGGAVAGYFEGGVSSAISTSTAASNAAGEMVDHVK